MKTKLAISILTVAQSLAGLVASPHHLLVLQEPTDPQAPVTDSKCETSGTSELTISCTYAAGPPEGVDTRTKPRIILRRAVISFIPSNESHMHVELTFTNDSGSKIADRRTVYLAIDDDKGENRMRRSLPGVNFTQLEPGKPVKFEETLLAPAFSLGAYTVSIWIPSTDPSLRFAPAHNLLLSSNGVPNSATGLNQIAKFNITSTGRRKSAVKPD
jgi:hypothetical protein